jgi:hypothetical protein
MKAILVHGVPDTEHVWHAVVALGRGDVAEVAALLAGHWEEHGR